MLLPSRTFISRNPRSGVRALVISAEVPCPSKKGYEIWVWRPSLLFFYRFRALGVGNREYIADLAEQIRRKRDMALVSAVWSMTTARRRTIIRNGINCTDLLAISLPSVILNHIDCVHPTIWRNQAVHKETILRKQIENKTGFKLFDLKIFHF